MARLKTLRDGFGNVNHILLVVIRTVWQSVKDYHMQRLEILPRTLPYIPVPTIEAPPYEPSGPPSTKTDLTAIASTAEQNEFGLLGFSFRLPDFDFMNLKDNYRLPDSDTFFIGAIVAFFIIITLYLLYGILSLCLRAGKTSEEAAVQKQPRDKLILPEVSQFKANITQFEIENATLWQDKKDLIGFIPEICKTLNQLKTECEDERRRSADLESSIKLLVFEKADLERSSYATKAKMVEKETKIIDMDAVHKDGKARIEKLEEDKLALEQVKSILDQKIGDAELEEKKWHDAYVQAKRREEAVHKDTSKKDETIALIQKQVKRQDQELESKANSFRTLAHDNEKLKKDIAVRENNAKKHADEWARYKLYMEERVHQLNCNRDNNEAQIKKMEEIDQKRIKELSQLKTEVTENANKLKSPIADNKEQKEKLLKVSAQLRMAQATVSRQSKELIKPPIGTSAVTGALQTMKLLNIQIPQIINTGTNTCVVFVDCDPRRLDLLRYKSVTYFHETFKKHRDAVIKDMDHLSGSFLAIAGRRRTDKTANNLTRLPRQAPRRRHSITYGDRVDTANVFYRPGEKPVRTGTSFPKHDLEPMKEDERERYQAKLVLQSVDKLAKWPNPRRYDVVRNKNYSLIEVGPGKQELLRLSEEHRFVLKDVVLTSKLSAPYDTGKIGEILAHDNPLEHIKIEAKANKFAYGSRSKDPYQRMLEIEMHWPKQEIRIKNMDEKVQIWKKEHPRPSFNADFTAEDRQMMGRDEAVWATHETILARDGISPMPFKSLAAKFLTKPA